MTEELQNMLREALLNNTYDHSSTHLALKMAWENSFSYLYRLQLEKVGYDEYMYQSNDIRSRRVDLIGHFYLDEYIRACVDIDKDIIHVAGRKEFRLSKFYHQYFTLQDMLEHNEIFQWIPIFIVDDRVVWDWEMKVVNKDAVQFRMPKVFKRSFVLKNERNPETDDVIYVEHKLQVLIVQNVYYERFEVYRMNLFPNDIAKSITIRKQDMDAREMPNKEKEGIYFITISFPADGDKAAYMGTQLIDAYESNDSITAYLSDNVYNKIAKYKKKLWVNLIYVNELHRKTWYTGNDFTVSNGEDCNLMVLNRGDDFEPYAHPVPTENFIIFRRRQGATNREIITNKRGVTMYYPNIYRITDPAMKKGDTYQVYYFYHYATSLKYTCLHDFWYRFLKIHFATPENDMTMEEILDRIWKNEMDFGNWEPAQIDDFIQTFEKVLNYTYKTYKYAETDFLYNWMGLKDPSDLTELLGKPFQYKEGRLKEWIRDDPWLLRDYVLEQKKVGTIYHLFTNQLDLTTRLRTTTKPEFDEEYEFDEPMYIFAMHNDREYPMLMDVRFFVDGIFVEKMYQDRKLFMDYIYIPARMVTDDSYLEMEVFPQYDFKVPLHFTSLDDVEEINIVEPVEANIWPTHADAYLMQRSGQTDEYTHLYENSLNEFFKVTSCYKEGEWPVETTDEEKPVRFTRLRKFKLQPMDEKVLNLDIDLCINKHPIGLPYRITMAGYPYLQLVGAENKFKYHPDYIRIYRNGRLLPNVKWAFYSTFECPRIQLMEWFEVGDTIFFDITPFRYKMIYYKDHLEPGELLIDLKNIVTKPFDWRYYDVYMNGRRMSMNNLFAITPWEMTMVNLKSLHNLAIYEKERDWEYYGLNYKEHIYFFTPDDLFDKDWITEDEINEIIKGIIDEEKDDRLNIYPNTDEEEIQDWEDLRKYVWIMAFYFNELIPKHFVEPSRLQFNKRIISEEYPIIQETYVRPGDMDARNETEKEYQADFPERMMLEPDILVEGENVYDLTYVYMVGHPGENMPQELLDEHIEIDDEEYALGGE